MHSRGQQVGAAAAFWERIDAEAYAEARGEVNPGEPSVVSEVLVQRRRRRCLKALKSSATAS